MWKDKNEIALNTLYERFDGDFSIQLIVEVACTHHMWCVTWIDNYRYVISNKSAIGYQFDKKQQF